MKKTILAMTGVLGVALAAVTLPAATRAAETAPSATVALVEAWTGYSQARVLKPGSRGSVVEI